MSVFKDTVYKNTVYKTGIISATIDAVAAFLRRRRR